MPASVHEYRLTPKGEQLGFLVDALERVAAF